MDKDEKEIILTIIRLVTTLLMVPIVLGVGYVFIFWMCQSLWKFLNSIY